MHIESARIKSYRSWQVDERPLSTIAKKRHKKLKIYNQLRSEGCSEKGALSAIEVSRATLYRWKKRYDKSGPYGLTPKSRGPKQKRLPMWSKQIEQQVYHLRKQNSQWGKKNITTLLHRERGIAVSESTVGRILCKLIKKGKVKPVCFYYGVLQPKNRRSFKHHAKRWQKGMKARKPGQLVQVDHMSVDMGSGFMVKHFQAICPVTKVTVSRAYKQATSETAALFLIEVIREVPFTITSIQVDGGSEFRQHFEARCLAQGIDLFVLPPRSPELNGCVERCNRTLRYEFYGVYDSALHMSCLNEALSCYMRRYNTYRPHQALNQNTPMAYYKLLEARKSHNM